MATARHPTTEAETDREDADDAHEPADRPAVGLSHPTVVPTNFERD